MRTCPKSFGCAVSRDQVHIGIDIGTGGVRCCAINPDDAILGEIGTPVSQAQRRNPAQVLAAVKFALGQLGLITGGAGTTLAMAGTSGSFLPLGADLRPVADISLYSDPASGAAQQSVRAVLSDLSGTGASPSVITRLIASLTAPGTKAIAFEADYFASVLAGERLPTDLNNALKAGADPLTEAWVPWTGFPSLTGNALPALVRPGEVIGQMTASIAQELGFATRPLIISGTTDGCASALAAGLERIGDAVTSLGSTLTLKILSDRPVHSAPHGIYSHRILGQWLVGGASNTGGLVLRHLFGDDLASLLPTPVADAPSGFDYVPLIREGERFPVADPQLAPRLTPRPADNAAYFLAVLDSLVRWERHGFAALTAVGAPEVRRLTAVGGGVRNAAWMATRRRDLPVDHVAPRFAQPAFGAAVLARHAVSRGATR